MIRRRRLYEVADIAAGAQLCVAHVAQPPRRAVARARLLVMVLLGCGAVTGVAGCGGGSATVDGAGADLATDAGSDGVTGDTQTPACTVGRTMCEGKKIRTCGSDKPAEAVACPSSCSFGRCTTTACAMIEGADGVRGCRFYGAQVDNTDADDVLPTLLLISNVGPEPATVRVQTRQADNKWAPMPMTEPVVVNAGETQRIRLSYPVRDVGITAGGAYRVDSDAPVMVVEIVGDDTERTSRSSGGTVLRPLQALGQSYLALTYAGENSLEVARTPGSRDGAGAITIVGTAPQTVVRLGVTAVATAMPGTNLQPRGEGEPAPEPFILNEGDVLQVFSVDSAGDLTGSTIEADGAVAVFSGNVFTSYGKKVNISNGADMVMEQLPPLSTWSSKYAGVRMSPQAACDSFFEGAGAGAWRVLATDSSSMGNHVTLKAVNGVTFEVDGEPPGKSDFVLAHGTARSFKVRGTTTTDFELMADSPVLLGQWLDCEPALSWGIDTRPSPPGEVAFGLPPGFETEMVVVRGTATPVLLDGVPLADRLFHPLSEFSAVEAARVPATSLRCIDQWDPCAHRLSGQNFAVSWRGMDVVCSYALTVPSRYPCAQPNAGCE